MESVYCITRIKIPKTICKPTMMIESTRIKYFTENNEPETPSFLLASTLRCYWTFGVLEFSLCKLVAVKELLSKKKDDQRQETGHYTSSIEIFIYNKWFEVSTFVDYCLHFIYLKNKQTSYSLVLSGSAAEYL